LLAKNCRILLQLFPVHIVFHKSHTAEEVLLSVVRLKTDSACDVIFKFSICIQKRFNTLQNNVFVLVKKELFNQKMKSWGSIALSRNCCVNEIYGTMRFTNSDKK